MTVGRVGRVAVVGGGITGLATAWFLRQRDVPVTLVEASDRLGGKIETSALGGVPVESGPDTFLARVPWAVDLCRQLGLEDDLVAPATTRAYVWTRGRLRPMPPNRSFLSPSEAATCPAISEARG